MTDVMTERREAQHSSPVLAKTFISKINRKRLPNLLSQFLSGENVKNPSCELHYSERVLEPLVSRSWIHKVRQCKLLDVPESLNRPGIHYGSFVSVETDKYVNRVANLVRMFQCGYSTTGDRLVTRCRRTGFSCSCSASSFAR